MRHFVSLIAAGLVVAATPPGATTPATHAGESCATCAAELARALADPRRDDDRARDQYRHPAETLAFFRVEPGMTVVDYMPSGGWYTRVLVPYLGPQGHYIGLNPDVRNGPESLKGYADLAATFPARAAGWTGASAAAISAYNTDTLPTSLDGKVDRVLIFREVHNLARYGLLDGELQRIHALLKPDGLLGIVEHRARADAPASYVDGSKGYMKQADVIRAVERNGYELVATSEVNANPKDTADYPRGVWTLPPSYALGDTDRDKYRAIGESDRMTLLFRKRG